MKEKRRKCTKCGSSPIDDPTVKLHRFPLPTQANKYRCELWAKFCFPYDGWQSPQFHNKLYSDHKMLCDKHFKSTSFKKDKLPSRLLIPDNDWSEKSLFHNNGQDSLANNEVVIKNEIDVEVAIQKHCVETRSELKRNPNEISEIYDSLKKKKAEQLRKNAKIEIDDSPKETNDTLDIEHSEIPQDYDDNCDELYLKTSKYEQIDDCLLYGKLLTKKLKTYSVYERNLLMYKIDGLLIENPPGFVTLDSNTINNSNKIPRKVKQRKNASSTSSAVEELHSYSTTSDKAPSLSKRKRTKEYLSQAVQISSSIEESSTITTQVTSTSMSSTSPVKITNDILNQPTKVTSSYLNQPAKVTSISKTTLKAKKCIQYQPIKVTSSIPNPACKVTSSISNKPVIVTKILNQPVASDAISLPPHLPLQITIPETIYVPVTKSKFVPSSYPKGKIVIMKSNSSKYNPSPQPPILIKVSSLPTIGQTPVSTQFDMNSLEQLSSIADTHAHTQHTISVDSDEYSIVNDINVVSHEVILAESSDSPSQNIVETDIEKLKNDK